MKRLIIAILIVHVCGLFAGEDLWRRPGIEYTREPYGRRYTKRPQRKERPRVAEYTKAYAEQEASIDRLPLADQFLIKSEENITPEMVEAYEQWKPGYVHEPEIRGTFEGVSTEKSWLPQWFKRETPRAKDYEQAYAAFNREFEPLTPADKQAVEHLEQFKVSAVDELYKPTWYERIRNGLRNVWRSIKNVGKSENESDYNVAVSTPVVDLPSGLKIEDLTPEEYARFINSMPYRYFLNYLYDIDLDEFQMMEDRLGLFLYNNRGIDNDFLRSLKLKIKAMPGIKEIKELIKRRHETDYNTYLNYMRNRNNQ